MAPRKKVHLTMRNGAWSIDLTGYEMVGMFDPYVAEAMRWAASRTSKAVVCVV